MTAKFSPHGRPVYGERITVIRRGLLEPAHFVTKRQKRLKRWYAVFHGYDDILLRPEDEGLTWTRGHDGPKVDALRTAAALSQRP